ncbi:MAG: hypothetical protein LUD51_05195 [Clostridia bacterium]|nr:hypothetical protein [Clostridia bacterium]
MTLLATVFAAVICTAVWYRGAPESKMMVSVLCWIYWGASLMWLVDAIFELVQEGSSYFTPEPADMLNDLFLGLSVIALGLVVWVIVLLIKDPRGVFLRHRDSPADRAADESHTQETASADPADSGSGPDEDQN